MTWQIFVGCGIFKLSHIIKLQHDSVGGNVVDIPSINLGSGGCYRPIITAAYLPRIVAQAFSPLIFYVSLFTEATIKNFSELVVTDGFLQIDMQLTSNSRKCMTLTTVLVSTDSVRHSPRRRYIWLLDYHSCQKFQMPDPNFLL